MYIAFGNRVVDSMDMKKLIEDNTEFKVIKDMSKGSKREDIVAFNLSMNIDLLNEELSEEFNLSELDEENGTYTLSAYLIAQLGKNFKDGANEKITGEQLLHAAVDTIKELQYMAGGMVIFLEAEDKEKLIHFYQEENGFKQFDVREMKCRDKDEIHKLVQLLKVM